MKKQKTLAGAKPTLADFYAWLTASVKDTGSPLRRSFFTLKEFYDFAAAKAGIYKAFVTHKKLIFWLRQAGFQPMETWLPGGAHFRGWTKLDLPDYLRAVRVWAANKNSKKNLTS